MAVGIKKSALVGSPCKIEDARLCPSCQIVTEREVCPLCEAFVVRHPEIGDGEPKYCTECAEEFPVLDLRVKTWSYDPYGQCDGDLVCVCRECLKDEADHDPAAVWVE